MGKEAIEMAGIADFVRNDLRHIRDVYQQTIAADPSERDTGGFVRDLTGYLVAEELVIAPVLEGKFADNAERQERIRKDYKSVGLSLPWLLLLFIFLYKRHSFQEMSTWLTR